MSQKLIDQAFENGKQEGFDVGAHQAMQETRLEIALGLIRAVCQEESPEFGLNSIAKDLSIAVMKFRDKSGRI